MEVDVKNLVGEYNVIYADPPWKFNKGVYQDNGRSDRMINEQYGTMSKKALLNLPINKLAHKDAALFLWVTDSHLKDGIELIEGWGFQYRTIVFIWKKITKNGKTCANVGAWTMKNCEVCLLGIRGNMLQHKKANNVFQLIESERTKHSRKPIETKKRIETLFAGLPKLELFCREKTEGWHSWGNEVESDIEIGMGNF